MALPQNIFQWCQVYPKGQFLVPYCF